MITYMGRNSRGYNTYIMLLYDIVIITVSEYVFPTLLYTIFRNNLMSALKVNIH